MGKEYEPTRRINSSGSGDDYTSPAGPSAGGGFYDSPVGQPGNEKTLRLRREPPSFAWLVIVDGIHAGHVFQLSSDSTTIGRDPVSCDVVLDDASASRQHAKIRVMVDDEKHKLFVIFDLATENGTLVNDEEVVKQELHDGDRVFIGQTKLVFKQVIL